LQQAPVRIGIIHLSAPVVGELSHPGPRAVVVAPGDASLPTGIDAVALVGDAVASSVAGPTLARLPIVDAVAAFAAAGGPVIGIGAGFQALCAAGLLPGSLDPAAEATGAVHDLVLRVEGQPTPFTQEVAAGRLLHLPGVCVAWRYHHDDPDALERAGQVVFRYVDEEGGVTAAADPSGSSGSVAGVCAEGGRAVGLAACPEHVLAMLIGPVDGVRLLDSLARYLADLRARCQ
jgi:phosphoribosylformylglycinamidine synthase subunit PurQ / glutaminase